MSNEVSLLLLLLLIIGSSVYAYPITYNNTINASTETFIIGNSNQSVLASILDAYTDDTDFSNSTINSSVKDSIVPDPIDNDTLHENVSNFDADAKKLFQVYVESQKKHPDDKNDDILHEVDYKQALVAAYNGNADARARLVHVFQNSHTKEHTMECLNWLLKSAKQGHPESQYFVGYLYEKGIGVEKNDSEAFYWYEKSAELGNPMALEALGVCYLFELGVPQNLTKAMDCILQAAEMGNDEAQMRLSSFYKVGFVVDVDEDKAFYWSKLSAEKGNKKALGNLGLFYKNGHGVKQNLTKAYECFLNAAKQGEYLAQFNLAECYKFGNGVKKNGLVAISWYLKSAKQGFPEAQYNLACEYILGDFIPIDFKEAAKWIKKSAEQGFVRALILLAKSYEKGDATLQDMQNAFCWFLKEAQNGDKELQYMVGLLYLDGIKGENSETRREAYNWFLKSAHQNDPRGQYNLASCLFYGIGVEVNKLEALDWYYESSLLGHADAQHRLAQILGTKDVVKKDLFASFYWYEKSALQGNEYGMIGLAKCFEYGLGTSVNKTQAQRFYKKAFQKFNGDAKKGVASAQYQLGLMYRHGRGVDKNLELAANWWNEAVRQNFCKVTNPSDKVLQKEDPKVTNQNLTKTVETCPTDVQSRHLAEADNNTSDPLSIVEQKEDLSNVVDQDYESSQLQMVQQTQQKSIETNYLILENVSQIFVSKDCQELTNNENIIVTFSDDVYCILLKCQFDNLKSHLTVCCGSTLKILLKLKDSSFIFLNMQWKRGPNNKNYVKLLDSKGSVMLVVQRLQEIQ